MSDMSFDAVVIGGGHHATIIANYLQNAGLETGVFERLHEMGGGAAGDELPAPAFLQNPCAHFTRMFGHPAYHDFNLRNFVWWIRIRAKKSFPMKILKRPMTRSPAFPNGMRTCMNGSPKDMRKNGEPPFENTAIAHQRHGGFRIRLRNCSPMKNTVLIQSGII